MDYCNRKARTLIFKRSLIAEPIESELIRDDSRQDRYYIDKSGNEYLSVTSWLGKQNPEAKQAIQDWRNAVGEVEADKISNSAKENGTAIHLACEQLLLNKPWQEISMFYRQDFLVMKKHLEENVNNIFALEHQMWSKTLGLAGTVDCIAEYCGTMSVIDFKTSSRIKYQDEISDYFLQCACYAIFLYERYKIKVSQLVILIVVIGDPKIHVFKQDFLPWGKKVLKLIKKE